MPSSLFGKIKLRLLDHALELGRRPNRIDTAATVSPLADVTASSLRGPVRVEDHARLHAVDISGPVTIGRSSSLWGPRVYVWAGPEPIEIGNFCSIGRDVSVHGFGHDPRRISTHYIGRNVLGLPIEDEITSRGPTSIGHDVWIGAGVHILSGVTIGTGAIIGAGSVVSRDVPPYAVAVGQPAAAVRYRFDESVIERLMGSEWWTWSREEIKARSGLFVEPLTDELLDRYLS
jgi:acetyltransferase-like isoleucine patch superfamily enzyme